MADLGSTRVFGNLSVSREGFFKGDITSEGSVTSNSDIRLKDNFLKISDALSKVCKLGGYTFDRIGSETPRQTGVIAQEVLEVLPEAVIGGPTEEDPEAMYSVAYGNMVGLLIEALKEERSERESLEERINKLEEILLHVDMKQR